MKARSTLAKNVLHNLVGISVPLLVIVVTLPPYLRLIGEARYGLLSLIWLLFGYFGLFDLGLSRSVANKLAQLGPQDPPRREIIFDSALLMNAILGVVAGALFLAVAMGVMHLFPGRLSGLSAEIYPALPLVSLLIPFALVGNVFVGRLQGEERFAIVNLIQIVGTVGMQVAPLICVYAFGANILYAIIGIVVARMGAIALLLMAVRAKRLRLPFQFDWAEGKTLLSYGGWLTVSNIVTPILVSADQFIIGYVLGSIAVAHYAIPFSFAQKALILPMALTGALFPRLSSLNGSEARALADRSLAILSSVMALLCVPGIFLVDLVLSLWLGNDFAAQARDVSRIILLGTWVSGMAAVPLCLLQGQGRVQLTAKIHAVELVPFIAMLFFLIKFFGLAGAAIAWSLRAIVEAGLLLAATGVSTPTLAVLGPTFILVLASTLGAIYFNPAPQIAVALAIITTLGPAWLLIKALPRGTLAWQHLRWS